MDAYTLVCGFAGINPAYFFDFMDLDEFQAIGKAYQNDWKKTQILAAAMGTELKLPWENTGPDYTRQQCKGFGAQIGNILNK